MILRQRSVLMRCIIYLTLFGTVTAGNTKYIRRGEPVQLISYSDIKDCTEVTVYINGVKNLTLIGQWKLEMCTSTEMHMNPEYEGRIAIDRYRNIWGLKVDGSDAAKYHIKCDKQNSPLEVELTISKELTEQDQIQKCQLDAACMKDCLGIIHGNSTASSQKVDTEVSGTGIISKFSCPGDSIQMFQNITFSSCNALVSLYINGERNSLIAMWSMQNCTLNSTFLPEYKEKVFLDKNGTLLMHDVHPWDQGKYVIMHETDTVVVKYEVQLYVMVAPAKDCRPKIMHVGNVLSATLKADICGMPVVTLYWREYGGVSKRGEPVLHLPPGKEAGTYHACIEGPALKCSRNSAPMDYCSTFIIGGNDSPTESSDIWDMKTNVIIIVGISLIILFLVVTSIIIIRKFCRRKIVQRKETRPDFETSLLQREHSVTENTQRKETIPLMEISQQQKEQFEMLIEEYPQLWQNYFGKLKWDKIMQLLNCDQQQGLRTQCEVLNGEYPQLWQNHLGKLQWENIMQLLNGDQLQGLRKRCEKLIEESPQLWQNCFGKLQWENIMQLLNSDQQQGLRKHCEVLNGEYPQLWQSHLGKLQWENIMQLLNGDQQQGLRKHCEKLIEESPQLWQNRFGKLQWENIMQLLNSDQQQGLRKHCEKLIEDFPQLWQNHFGKLQWEIIMQLLNSDQQQSFRKYCDAEAEKIKDRERSKKRQNRKVMKRTGESIKDVYRFLCDNKLYDPNVLE